MDIILPLQKIVKSYYYLISMILIVITNNCFAQEQHIEWGEVSQADLEMLTFPADSNASAVILFDYGKAEFSYDFEFVFTRHVRIKILNESGYKWGTVKLKYLKEHKTPFFEQELDILEAHTLNYDQEGEIVETEVDDDDIFEENVDDKWYRKRFTFPKLQPGSIIEYKYNITSKSAQTMDEWIFQHKIPCRWSEFRFDIPEILRYVQVSQGFHPFHIQEVKAYNGQLIRIEKRSKLFFSGGLRKSGVKRGEIQVNGLAYHWAMKDVPALTEEPHITTLENYRSKISFQLSEIKPLYSQPTQFLNTWELLEKEILKHKMFGRQIESSGILEDEAQKISDNLNNHLVKLDSIYSFVCNAIKWNGKHRLFAENDLDDVFEAKSGNSAEISFILISMLREIGIESYPIITSTRDHGYIQPLYPITEQFNHVMTLAKVDDKEFILDATDPFRPMTMLPLSSLQTRGFVLNENGGYWVDISTTENYNQSSILELKLSENGTLSGKINISFKQYSAYSQRKKNDETPDRDYIKKYIFTDFNDVRIDSFSIKNKKDLNLPVRIEIHFSIPEVAQVNGDFLYLNPHIINRMSKNPFSLSIRNYPVEFECLKKYSCVTNIILPSGYNVVEYPKNSMILVPGKKARLKHVSTVDKNIFRMHIEIAIKDIFFEIKEYDALKEFYDSIVEVYAKQIVLKKEKIGTN